MSEDAFRELWDSLTAIQRESVKQKARWEQMSLRAVVEEWPGIWNDPQRLAALAGKGQE